MHADNCEPKELCISSYEPEVFATIEIRILKFWLFDFFEAWTLRGIFTPQHFEQDNFISSWTV
jgi:hypothetical protein